MIDLRLFSTDPEISREFYVEHLLGTARSNWPTLRLAAASLACHATRQFAELVNLWHRLRSENEKTAGEIEFLVHFNYGTLVSGPALASVLLPSFAIEAFLRLITEVSLYETTEGPDALRLALK